MVSAIDLRAIKNDRAEHTPSQRLLGNLLREHGGLVKSRLLSLGKKRNLG